MGLARYKKRTKGKCKWLQIIKNSWNMLWKILERKLKYQLEGIKSPETNCISEKCSGKFQAKKALDQSPIFVFQQTLPQ